MRNPICYAGQRVITTAGQVVVVAFVIGAQVWAFVSGSLQPVQVVTDAWGGEADQEVGIAA